MPLNREQFLAKFKAGKKPELFKLPDGSEVLMLPISAKLYREYQSSLRNEKGERLEERRVYGDELLVARCLVDEAGNRMFSDEDILGGIFDELKMLPVGDLVRETYKMLGLAEPDEDREKNSSTTDSIEPS